MIQKELVISDRFRMLMLVFWSKDSGNRPVILQFFFFFFWIFSAGLSLLASDDCYGGTQCSDGKLWSRKYFTIILWAILLASKVEIRIWLFRSVISKFPNLHDFFRVSMEIWSFLQNFMVKNCPDICICFSVKGYIFFW